MNKPILPTSDSDPLLLRLRAEWQRRESLAMPPLTPHEALAAARRRRGPTPHALRCRAAWRQWLPWAVLTAACLLWGWQAFVCDLLLLLLSACLVGMPALWHMAACSHRLYLLWHLAPARHAPSRHLRYALRLQRAEARQARRRQWWHRRAPQPALRLPYRVAMAMLCGVLLMAAGSLLWARPATLVGGTSVTCVAVHCNNGCAATQPLGAVAALFALA